MLFKHISIVFSYVTVICLALFFYCYKRINCTLASIVLLIHRRKEQRKQVIIPQCCFGETNIPSQNSSCAFCLEQHLVSIQPALLCH